MAIKTIDDPDKWMMQKIDEMGGEAIAFRFPIVDPDTGAAVLDPVTGQKTYSETFRVPHPMLIEEEQEKRFQDASTTVESAKALLNTDDDDEVYSRFRDAGGKPGLAVIMYMDLAKEMRSSSKS